MENIQFEDHYFQIVNKNNKIKLITHKNEEFIRIS